jgi:Starch-binding associating with outer membrane
MKKIAKILMLCLMIMSIAGCDLDINVDPNNPNQVPNAQLLSSAQVAIFTSFGHNASGLAQPVSLWVHQVMIRSNADSYGSTGTDANISNPWANLYSGALEDLDVVIKQGTEKEEFRYVGIAKLLKAYSYSMMVDSWGDIPFSEAVKGTSFPFPKFDDDAEIYAALFPLIDEGIADLTKPLPSSLIAPGADDLIYGGSVDKWRRFGKVLKLKMYNTIKDVANVNTEINTLIGDTDVNGFVDDFELKYFNIAAPENRNPAWLSVSAATTYVSRYFYEILVNKSTLNTVLSGIVDPRYPYYVYNSLGTSNPNPVNPVEYRDGNFLAVNFSSQHPNQGFDQSAAISMPGVYFCGGRLDPAGVGGRVVVSSAPGNAPMRLLTSYMISYIMAEVALKSGDLTGARSHLISAINKSFAKVNSVTTTVFPSAVTISNSTRDNYITAVMALYDGYTTNAKRLEMIITQKWIANFGNSLESYTDFRRTGYPVMFDPNSDGDSNTNLGRGYPFSLPYRQIDLQLNPNAPAQKLIADPSAKVFWDIN